MTLPAPTLRHTNPQAVERYRAREGDECPYCQKAGFLDTGKLESTADGVTIVVDCKQCGAKFKEWYDLVDIERIS